MSGPEDVAAEKYFTPPEPDRELESLIHFWKDSLAVHRLLMSPSTVYLVEQTIKAMEKLKQIEAKQVELEAEGEIVKLDEDQASLFKEGS